MENQKAEALLNLAADATTEELKKAEELSVGYDEGKGIWEIIIKYPEHWKKRKNWPKQL